jgi:hypothetical protein
MSKKPKVLILVPRPQAAGECGCCSRVLYNAERDGLLTPYKRNSRVVCYEREQLEAFKAGMAVAKVA